MSDRKKMHALRVVGAGLKENIRMALDTLRSNKGRSGLVILGVGIGVTTLMAMVSIIEGTKGRLEEEITATDAAYIHVTRFNQFSDNERERDNPELGLDEWIAIENNCPSVRFATPLVGFGTIVRHGSESAELMELDGIGTRGLEFLNVGVVAGRWLNAADWAGRRDVCCIPEQPAERLFPNQDPIGKKIRVNEFTELTVVGVIGNRESIFGAMANNYVMAPWPTVMKHFPWLRQYSGIIVAPDGKDNIETAREEVQLALRILHKLGPGEEDDFHMATQDQAVEFTRQVTGPLTLVGVVLASIGLMVGGIGVVTIMLVSVKERTREIGIRKAVGGRQQDILMQFLVEAATLTALGGAAGVVMGLLIGQILKLTLHLPATVPVLYVIGALVVSSATGIFFGLYPAVQAAKQDPVDALSYE